MVKENVDLQAKIHDQQNSNDDKDDSQALKQQSEVCKSLQYECLNLKRMCKERGEFIEQQTEPVKNYHEHCTTLKDENDFLKEKLKSKNEDKLNESDIYNKHFDQLKMMSSELKKKMNILNNMTVE